MICWSRHKVMACIKMDPFYFSATSYSRFYAHKKSMLPQSTNKISFFFSGSDGRIIMLAPIGIFIFLRFVTIRRRVRLISYNNRTLFTSSCTLSEPKTYVYCKGTFLFYEINKTLHYTYFEMLGIRRTNSLFR